MKKIVVVLMDIDKLDESGIKGVSVVKEAKPETAVIMCAAFENGEKLFELLCAGANSYLLKKTPHDKLFNAIKELVEAGAFMNPSITRKVSNRFRTPKAADSYELTEREIQVLRLLTDGHSSKIIATNMNIGFETVRSHLKNIYQKLHVNCGKEAIGKALRERLL